MSAAAVPDRAQRRIRFGRVTLFTAASLAAFPLALIPPAPPQRGAYLLAAAAVFVVVGLAIVYVPWDRLPESSRFTMVAGYCLAVALLRESAGGTAGGYAPLLLIPVLWQALYGRAIDLATTIAAAFLTLVLPILLVGGSAYPTAGWRPAALSTITYSLAAVTVRQLLERVRRHEAMTSSVVALTRGLSESTDIRDRIIFGLQEITHADVAVFSELDGTGRLRVSASSDHQVAQPMTDTPTSWIGVVELGTPWFAARTDHGLPPFVSVLHQPVFRGPAAVGVITLGWSRPHRQPPALARQAVELIAAEAATAIERAELMERVTRLARHDELTGLFNRRSWDEHLTMEMSRADRTGSTLCVALLDLDHFKRFNDAHGHLAGDQLLKAAAAAWNSQLRPTDLLARWGGEEFALALPETDLEGAVVVLDRLRDTTPMGQTFSAGVVEVSGRDAFEVMQSADSALYLAKENGRDRVVAFDATGRQRSVVSAGS